MANNDFDKWDMKVAEWRGYTLRALEDLNGDVQHLKKSCDNMEKKLENIENKLTNQTIKIGITSGIIGLFAGLIVSVMVNILI